MFIIELTTLLIDFFFDQQETSPFRAKAKGLRQDGHTPSANR
jgi:hypothetical protein